MDVLHVDCDSCVGPRAGLRGLCDHGAARRARPAVDLDPEEQAALSALADSGLVPPLRLIPGRLIPARLVGVQAPLDWQDYA